MVGKVSNLPQNIVNQCAKWHSQQIRKMPREVAAAAIGDELNRIALAYGVRQKPHEDVVKECLAIIGMKFAHLAPAEIREAYRAWASNEIEVYGAEMYGGQINARQVGSVLYAYSEYRKTKMGPYLSALAEIAEREGREILETKKREAFEETFTAALAAGVEKFETWEDVPEFWYDSLLSRGEISITKDVADAIFERAERESVREQSRSITEKLQTRHIFQKIADRDARRKVIARKIAVYQLYILPRQVENKSK